jgi:hypothetical protein
MNILRTAFVFLILATVSALAQDPSLTVNVTIPVGTAVSSPVTLRAGCIPGAIIIPSGWTAANLTFRVSNDNGTTWGNLRDEFKTEIVVSVQDASDVIRLNPADWYWMRNRSLIIRSGTSTSPVNQTGTDKVLKVLCGR